MFFRIVIIAFILVCMPKILKNILPLNGGHTVSIAVAPFIMAFLNIICATLLYNAQSGIIKDDSKWNKYKLKSNSVLIKLKIFKYNNDANWLLVAPYLLAWIVDVFILVLYFIYACGAVGLNALFTSTWFIFVSCSILPIIIVYYILIREKILESYKNEKPSFVMDKKKEEEIKNEQIEISQNKTSARVGDNRDMTNKELILDSLIDDDECFTQIVEFFDFAEVDISIDELQKTLDEMVEEGYISINYKWQNEHDEYPYALTEKGKQAWKDLGI